MPEANPSENYYRAARELLPEMDEVMRRSVEALLRQAEIGAKTDNQIVETICTNPTLRVRLRELLKSGTESTMLDYSALGGDLTPPEAPKYICPVPGHDYIRRIQKIGEDPGVCPKHKKALIPIQEKESH